MLEEMTLHKKLFEIIHLTLNRKGNIDFVFDGIQTNIACIAANHTIPRWRQCALTLRHGNPRWLLPTRGLN